MRRRRAFHIIVAVVVITAIGPVLAAIFLARQQALDTGFERATDYAHTVAGRSDRAVAQMQEALDTLLAAGSADPCSEEMLTLMRQLGMRMEYTRVVGAVRGGRMICSSLGVHEGGLELGPPDTTTPVGMNLRLGAPMSLGSETPYISLERDGFIAMAHRNQAVDMVVDQEGVLFATFDPITGELRTGSEQIASAWIDAVASAPEAAFVDGNYIVGVVRSAQVSRTGAVAAIPLVYLGQQVRAFVWVLLPLGLVTAMALTYAVLFFARMQVSLPTQIRQGLRRNEFFLVYQPVVDLRTGRWVGAEALLRWRRSDGRLVSPDEFIPAAEQSGLISQLTDRVVEIVQKDIISILWKNPDFFLTINLSAMDLQSGEMLAKLRQLIHANGVRANQVMVELTERTLVDAIAARDILASMRSHGIRVAIDDFGTGYCSLSYLETMKFDSLKIDRLFVEAIDTEAATNRVVLHIIEMARALNLTLIAEGVEREAQAEYLREHGVEYAQGWLYSKALPPAELLEYLA